MVHRTVTLLARRTTSCRSKPTSQLATLFVGVIQAALCAGSSAHAQASLPLPIATQLAAESAPSVNVGTLLAFAWFESKLRPWAIHDNTTRLSEFPISRAEAVARASTLLSLNHNLDLGLCQVNSANLARTGLTVTTAFDPGRSMQASAAILVPAYQRCLHGNDRADRIEQQAALRCAASIYNTGREQAGILNGYQSGVWRAAEQIVPAIQFSAAGNPPSPPAKPEDVMAPVPRPPLPSALEDALHATPPVPVSGGGFTDALHLASRKDDAP
jgi:type IV secretion system protein VirB1